MTHYISLLIALVIGVAIGYFFPRRKAEEVLTVKPEAPPTPPPVEADKVFTSGYVYDPVKRQMRRVLPVLMLLCIPALTYAADTVFNPFTGKLDYIAQPGTGGPVTNTVFKAYTTIDRLPKTGGAIYSAGATGTILAITQGTSGAPVTQTASPLSVSSYVTGVSGQSTRPAKFYNWVTSGSEGVHGAISMQTHATSTSTWDGGVDSGQLFGFDSEAMSERPGAAVFGGNIIGKCWQGATNCETAGLEIDVVKETEGGTRGVLWLVGSRSHTDRPGYQGGLDAMLIFANKEESSVSPAACVGSGDPWACCTGAGTGCDQGATPRFKHGIIFKDGTDPAVGEFPVDTTGTIIGTDMNNAWTVANIIDFSSANMTVSGHSLKMPGSFNLKGDGRLGLGVDPTYKLDTSETYTGTAATIGSRHLLTLNPSATVTGAIQNGWYSLETSTAQNYGTLIGLAGRVFHSGSGTVTNIRGANIVASNEGTSGTATTLIGGQFQATSKAGTTTTAIGGRFIASKQHAEGQTGVMVNGIAGKFEVEKIATGNGNGTITNAYGLYITNVNQGDTLNYSLYSEGGTALFNTGAAGVIGQVIKGASSQTANLSEWRDSSDVVKASIGADGTVTTTKVVSTGSISMGTNSATCDSTIRGTIRYVAGGAGVADVIEACTKAAADTYAWRDIAAPVP